MIAHVVLLEPRSELATEGERALLDTLLAARRAIPAIRRMQVGRRVRLDRHGYETAMVQDYRYLLLVTFDDAEGLTTYLDHPAHAALGERFTSASAAALAYDYLLADIEDALNLLSR